MEKIFDDLKKIFESCTMAPLNIKNRAKVSYKGASCAITMKKEELDFLENPEYVEKEIIILNGKKGIFVSKKEEE